MAPAPWALALPQEGRLGGSCLASCEGPSLVTMGLFARAPCPWVWQRLAKGQKEAKLPGGRHPLPFADVGIFHSPGAGAVTAFTPVCASAGGWGGECILLYNFCASETFHNERKSK